MNINYKICSLVAILCSSHFVYGAATYLKPVERRASVASVAQEVVFGGAGQNDVVVLDENEMAERVKEFISSCLDDLTQEVAKKLQLITAKLHDIQSKQDEKNSSNATANVNMFGHIVKLFDKDESVKDESIQELKKEIIQLKQQISVMNQVMGGQ